MAAPPPAITPTVPTQASDAPGSSNSPGTSAALEPTILISGKLYTKGGSSKYVPKSVKRKIVSWKPKKCEVLSDGTFRYQSLITDSSSSSSSSSSDSGSSDEKGFSAPLLPYGASPLSRDAQLALGKLPKGCTAAGAFTLRMRGPGGAQKLRFVSEGRQMAEAWCTAAEAGARAAVLHGDCPLLDIFEGQAGEDGKVAAEEVSDILEYANYENYKGEVKAGSTRLGYAEFLAVLKGLWVTNFVTEIWEQLGGENCGVGEVAKWMGVEEGMIMELFKKRGVEEMETLNAGLLQALICSELNDACDPAAVAIGDMGKSMSEYFVNSSHNSYLEGSQLQSDSSAAMYRMVLESGARCVEIDMWDGDDSLPIVTHGHTVCGTVPLRSVVAEIGKAAFVASEYPVILSLENHLSGEQQQLAAGIFREELGEMLEVVHVKEGEMLPSPESLKGKILIKAKMGQWGKKLGPGGAMQVEEDSDDDDEGAGSEASEYGGGAMADRSADEDSSASCGPPRTAGLLASFKKKFALSKSADKSEKKTNEKKKSIVVVKELADITSFGGANRKQLCALWVAGNVHPDGQLSTDIVSLNEDKVAELFVEGQGKSLQEYNRRNMTRVYPKGTRVKSSNYNPLVGWAAGCQITALNFQTGDEGMWLNSGRFKVNGGCGYVLKSAPAGEGKRVMHGAGFLNIKVLFGSMLPKLSSSSRDVIDPYVQLTLVRVDRAGGVENVDQLTKVVTGNGLSPVWNEKMPGFSVTDAHLDMLLVRVWDKDTTSMDDMIGVYAAPVHALRTGIRCFNLLKSDGAPLRAHGTYLAPSIVCELDWKPAPSSTTPYSALT